MIKENEKLILKKYSFLEIKINKIRLELTQFESVVQFLCFWETGEEGEKSNKIASRLLVFLWTRLCFFRFKFLSHQYDDFDNFKKKKHKIVAKY